MTSNFLKNKQIMVAQEDILVVICLCLLLHHQWDQEFSGRPPNYFPQARSVFAGIPNPSLT